MNAKSTLKYAVFFLSFISLFSLLVSCNNKSENKKKDTITFEIEVSELETLAEKFSGPIPKDKAAKMVKSYRRITPGTFQTNMVFHHQDSVKFYMDSIFLKYTPGVTLPTHHVWRVAFSPMVYQQTALKPRLTFCLLPCIVDTSKSPVVAYDFFEEMANNSNYYTKYFEPLYKSIGPLTIRGKRFDEPGFIFDEGQLWP